MPVHPARRIDTPESHALMPKGTVVPFDIKVHKIKSDGKFSSFLKFSGVAMVLAVAVAYIPIGGHNISHRAAQEMGSMAIWDDTLNRHVLMVQSVKQFTKAVEKSFKEAGHSLKFKPTKVNVKKLEVASGVVAKLKAYFAAHGNRRWRR